METTSNTGSEGKAQSSRRVSFGDGLFRYERPGGTSSWVCRVQHKGNRRDFGLGSCKTVGLEDACRFTGISRSTLYLLIARGEVEVIKLGSATLVLTESLRQLIERHRNAGSSLNTNTDPKAPG
ncbi:helix-turn-helix domain-containing protein [Blastomonas sp. CCH1-A6]|uniref:helix-turn-helix domain-containing protein n=1 Tax=Blastomonas sp. CCH1-A6 TaxID=1768762 RepID=UPI0009E9AB39